MTESELSRECARLLTKTFALNMQNLIHKDIKAQQNVIFGYTFWLEKTEYKPEFDISICGEVISIKVVVVSA